MNPAYVSGGYFGAPATTNTAFMNSGEDYLPPPALLSTPQPNHPHHFAGIPLQYSINHDDQLIHQGIYLTPPETETRLPSCAMSLKNVFMGSKYLKPVQELLDEVVSVVNGNSCSSTHVKKGRVKEESAIGGGTELTIAEMQERQMKKAKLVNMLDEVEQRYKQYHQQMQAVMSSSEAMAGIGAAKTYTNLALQTISRKFRCLRDAISGEIQAVSRSLGEEDCYCGGSGLRYIDHHVRKQRALQKLGMMQHSAWKPQRGLPGNGVSILRSWLFEHFLHPYPKDSDKKMLAKQTGLTRSQVSNWFINARVRLWKPMVEEMYLEEINDQQEHKDLHENKTCKSDGYNFEESESNSSAHEVISCTSRTEHDSETPPPSCNDVNKAKSDQATLQCSKDESGFGAYMIGEMERFDSDQFGPRFFSGNGGSVSLTLGLSRCESFSIGAGTQQSYVPNVSMEMDHQNSECFSMINNGNSPVIVHPFNAYESISAESRKRFAGHELLPDFVA